MEPSNSSLLATEKVGKLMRKYAIPCILSLLVGALYNIVDQIFIANAEYLGSYGNAANTVVFPLTAIALAIAALDGARKGERVNMKVFDNREFEEKREEYAKEAREKWGDTAAYQESAEKTADFSADKWNSVNAALDERIADFAACKRKGFAPDSPKAQALVKNWQDCITEHFYTCTKEILAGLADLYVADERFLKNIDRHGDGTAQYMCDAIKAYVQ